MTRVFPAPSDSSPVAALVESNAGPLTLRATPAELAASVFDLRRGLVESLIRQPDAGVAQQSEDSSYAASSLPSMDAAHEDILRDSLPPLLVPSGPYTPVFSAWRGAIVAVVGLICGSAVAQGLALSGAAAVLLSTMGVGGALWLADMLAHASACGTLQLGSCALRWKTLRRVARLLWGAALVLTLLRDFLQQNPALQDILTAVSGFLTQGSALALLQNMYWLLALSLLFALASRKPARLDVDEYRLRLHIAAQAWWDGALLARTGILARHEQLHGKQSLLRQKAAQELCSFAAELPSAQSFWLRERLLMLGFSALSPDGATEGEVRWHNALAATYDVVGHVEDGDRCYVDTVPLMDGERMARKGTLRKVRV